MKLDEFFGMDVFRAATARFRLMTEAEADDGDGPDLYKFKYPNYKLDPEPRVIVLGHYRNPNTGNDLLGGLNVNYMTVRELLELRAALPRIMRGANLKERYWIGRRVLPDLFKPTGGMYRTYRKDFIREVPANEIGELARKAAGKAAEKGYAPRMSRIAKAAKLASELPDEQDPLADIKKKSDTIAHQQRADKLRKAADDARRELAADRSKVGPDSLEPDRETSGAAEAPEPPRLPRRGEQAEPGDIEKALGIGREGEPREPNQRERPQQPRQPRQPQQPASNEPGGDDLAGIDSGGAEPDEAGRPGGMPGGDELSRPPGKAPRMEGLVNDPIVGRVWLTPVAFRHWHRPEAFLASPLYRPPGRPGGRQLLAVIDATTGETLVDHARGHDDIIESAGWGDDHTIRLLASGGTLTALHSGLPRRLVRERLAAVPARLKRLLVAQARTIDR